MKAKSVISHMLKADDFGCTTDDRNINSQEEFVNYLLGIKI